MVKAKKHLGQHFLRDKNIAAKIARTLPESAGNVLEIGPGTGVLTSFLLQNNHNLKVIEIDDESVEYLKDNKILPAGNIIHGDFLKTNPREIFDGEEFAVTGNFPYNISSQIVFKVLEYRDLVPVFTGMFQKEVAERIAMKPGSKLYGILSVLTQAFYDVEYLFTVPPTVFLPPPKVNSGVIRMVRKSDYSLSCDEAMFFKVVKTAFNRRRKMLRSSLRELITDPAVLSLPLFTRRPEQLSVEEFEEVVKMVK
jgi:16S rRNA (adenine1518-N6/adenine1519-N6)-dimethyltransferase